jgi:hypothetical protein
LRFVELNFKLLSLGYADDRADALGDCFDFHKAPLGFRDTLAPLNASQFLQDKRTPTNPDND